LGGKYLKNVFTKDEFGKDLLLDTHTGYQTMMEWEKPYMKAIIDRLSPKGDVLEIGFGMGYSADEIQKHDISSHTIIESDPIVLKKLKEWATKQKHKVIIVEGSWQDKLKDLGKFDSIFFDDAPNSNHPDPNDIRFYYFYYSVLSKHVNVGCRMSVYADSPTVWLCGPEIDYSVEKVNIKIAKNAKYIKNKFHGNVLYVPLMIFKYGTVKSFFPVYLDKNGNTGVF
jgi:hypothetical protein